MMNSVTSEFLSNPETMAIYDEPDRALCVANTAENLRAIIGAVMIISLRNVGAHRPDQITFKIGGDSIRVWRN